MVTWVKSAHFFSASSANYSIRFNDVNGLKAGDMVTVFGYPSGKVEEIRLTPTGAVADISLNDEVQLHQDVRAEIMVKELMGGKQIEIKPGVAGSVLPPGSLFDGTTSLDFSSAFDRMGEFMEAFDPVQMDSLLTNLTKASKSMALIGGRMEDEDLDGTFRDLSESARHLNVILAQVESRHLVARLDTAFDKLGNLAEKGEETMTSVNGLSGRLQSTTLPEAEALMKQVSGMLTETEATMADARDLLQQMKNKQTIAGKLLYDEETTKDFDLLIDNLNETLEFLRTKKVHVAMSLRNKQREFGEESGEGAVQEK
jgi:phospholipid/cholesterol/gamma-HCH transport system substrate-binding protein